MPDRVARSAAAAAAWTGFAAAAVAAFVAVVVSVAFWIPDAGASGSSGSVVHAGVFAFLAALHGGIVLSGVPIGFLPLGLTLLAGWRCWRSAAVLCSLPVVADRRELRDWAPLLALHVAAYAATVLLLCAAGRIGTSHVPVAGALAGAVVVCTVFSGAAVLRHTGLGGRLGQRLPAGVRASGRAALGGLSVLLAGAAVLTLAATVLSAGRLLQFTRALGTGASGLPVGTLSVASAPNMVIAALAYLAGPGFAVGTGSHYGALSDTAGLVPALPPLAVLPTHGPSVVALVFAVVVVVAAGTVTGLLAGRAAGGYRSALTRAAGAAALIALAGAVLAWLGGGSLGARQLRTVGAAPLPLALTLLVETGVLAVLVAAVARAVSPARRHGLQLVLGGDGAARDTDCDADDDGTDGDTEDAVRGAGAVAATDDAADSGAAGDDPSGRDVAAS